MESTQTARSAPSATTGVRAGVAGARRVELPVSGLTCHNCVQAVERALRAVPGVTRATVNLAGGRAFVDYDPTEATVSALHEAVRSSGYRAGATKGRFGIRGATWAPGVAQTEG